MGGFDAGSGGDGYCLPGHRGPLCRVCTESDFYFKSTAWACVPCADNWWEAQKKYGGSFLMPLALVLTYALFNGLVYHQVYGMAATRKRLKRSKSASSSD